MIEITRAGDNDRQIVEEIGKHYDPSFINHVYNTWEERGGLYIARREGRTVGFCGLVFPAPTEAQILGIRLLPDFQREDVGRQFVIGLIQVAQEKGCNTVRMLTSTENWETQAALQRNLNFVRRGTWAVAYREEMRSELCDSRQSLEPASPEILDDIWQYLQYSMTYRHSEGLIFNNGYTYRQFSKAYLNQLLEQGRVYACDSGGVITGVIIAHCQDDTMHLHYVDAQPTVVKDLLLGILARHCECKCNYLTAAVPTDSYREIRPLLEQVVKEHAPDYWLVMEKEVSPLALPRD
ncbi:MAG: GNAT family N-acetyltransferase [Firmicutes bacterium]|nr:GNAT family N-acetyltransferase [Bacillota bacterium]